MMCTGKVVALQALLDYHSLGQKPDVFGRGVVSVQLQAKFTQEAVVPHTAAEQTWPTWTVSLFSSEHEYTDIVSSLQDRG